LFVLYCIIDSLINILKSLFYTTDGRDSHRPAYAIATARQAFSSADPAQRGIEENQSRPDGRFSSCRMVL
jgi:hypothetical protein